MSSHQQNAGPFSLAILPLLLALIVPSGVSGASLVVNSNLNAADQNIGNGQCETALADTCTLLAALQEANGSPSSDTITFSSQMEFDVNNTPLPAITGSHGGLTIDGSGQLNGGRPGIVLKTSAGCGNGSRGLEIVNSSVPVVIKGIEFQGGGSGIIISGSSNITIGGAGTGERNIFQTTADGIWADNANDLSITTNWFSFVAAGDNFPSSFQDPDQYMGTRAIYLQNSGFSGALEINDNLMGEYQYGVDLWNSGNLDIINNNIGNYANSNNSFPCGTGLRGTSVWNLTIRGNVIAQNTLYQINISSFNSSSTITENTIGSTYVAAAGTGIRISGSGISIANNIIRNNDGNGVELDSSTGIELTGNWITANTGSGVYVDNASNTIIGGVSSNLANLIGDNHEYGIHIRGASSRENHIGGNMIGYDTNTAQNISNGRDGVRLEDQSEANRVGLIGDIVAPNTIGSNLWSGVALIDSNHNRVGHNYIGTDSNNRSLGNLGWGVMVKGNNNVVNNNVIAYNGLVAQRAGIAVEEPHRMAAT